MSNKNKIKIKAFFSINVIVMIAIFLMSVVFLYNIIAKPKEVNKFFYKLNHGKDVK